MGVPYYYYRLYRLEENGHHLAIRSKAEGVCDKVFQAIGMAMPPTIREI